MVTNLLASYVQHLDCLQNGEKDIKLVANPRNDIDTMDIYNSHLRDSYKRLGSNTSEIFGEITQAVTLQNVLIPNCFNISIKDSQIFAHVMWIAIEPLRSNTISKENRQDERMKCINTYLQLNQSQL
jgi:hypothetical protein